MVLEKNQTVKKNTNKSFNPLDHGDITSSTLTMILFRNNKAPASLHKNGLIWAERERKKL